MEEEIDLFDMLKYFWRKKVLIICTGILFAVLAIIFTKFLLEPEYISTSSFILINDDLKTEAEVYSYAKLPDRYYAITDSMNVLNKVITNLKLDDFKDIEEVMKFKEKNIEITCSPANFIISVKVTTDNAKKAADIANEIVRVSIEEIKNIYKDEQIYVLDFALENAEPVNLKLISNILKFVLVGEVFVCGYVMMYFIFVEKKKNNI